MAIPQPLSSLEHLIRLADLSAEAVAALLDYAIEQKQQLRAGTLVPTQPRKALAMIFEKSSLRTRVSFEVAMTQLGGHAICLEPRHIGMGKRESVADIARVTGRICDAIMARTFLQRDVEDLAAYAGVPVINGLTDELHPCQALADMMTVQEHFGSVVGKTVVFVGDGNNVARSLAWACARLGGHFVNVGPTGYLLEPELLETLRQEAPDLTFTCTADIDAGVAEADVIYADTWVSMGQEDEAQHRKKAFAGYQINAAMMAKAPKTAVVMHCLPAYREVEITSEVMDSPQSVVFDQAENRLHVQRALLDVLLTNRATRS